MASKGGKLQLVAADTVLLLTVDLYRRAGCGMLLEPVYRVLRQDGQDRVERGWRVTVDPPTLAPRLPVVDSPA